MRSARCSFFRSSPSVVGGWPRFFPRSWELARQGKWTLRLLRNVSEKQIGDVWGCRDVCRHRHHHSANCVEVKARQATIGPSARPATTAKCPHRPPLQYSKDSRLTPAKSDSTHRRRSTGTDEHAIRLMDSFNPTLRATFVSETIAALFVNFIRNRNSPSDSGDDGPICRLKEMRITSEAGQSRWPMLLRTSIHFHDGDRCDAPHTRLQGNELAAPLVEKCSLAHL
jgi:hypothetical protein